MSAADTPIPLLGGLSPARFLRDYWQKRPLLIRGAMPDFRTPITPEELAGLACEDGVAARIVLEKDGATPWEVRYAPFDEEDFTRLPSSHWTVLVTDVEKHVPELRSVIAPFRFIPDWRIDDLMISYAAPQGSVGPHVDAYDVFLLQASGRRRWQISTRPVEPDDFVPGLELRILREFVPEQEWVLEPGDMLYLPPGIAHHGVAVDACMTYSVGFRAPSHRELLTGFLEDRIGEVDPHARYTDPDLVPQAVAGEIDASALAKVREILAQHLALDDDRLGRWLGRHLTEPKADLEELYPDNAPLAPHVLAERLRAGAGLLRAPAARLAFVRGTQGPILFADGEAFALPASALAAAEQLSTRIELDHRGLANALDDEAVLTLLAELFARGIFYFEDDA